LDKNDRTTTSRGVTKLIKKFVLSVATLAAISGCFGSLPSYYSKDSWDTAEEANKIQIIKKVSNFKDTAALQFAWDEWKSSGYAEKMFVIDGTIARLRNYGVFIKLPSSFLRQRT
jgi:hypothetical protein